MVLQKPNPELAVLNARSRYSYEFHVAITKVNRQIKDEAYDVLRKENLFVRVSSSSLVLHNHREWLKPIILAQHREACCFKHCAMTVALLPREGLPYGNRFPLGRKKIFIIALEDLPLLCKLLVVIDVERAHTPILGCGYLEINVGSLRDRDVMSDDTDPALDSITVRRLLEPLRFLRGLGGVKIKGDVSEAYIKDINDTVNTRIPSAKTLRGIARSAQEEGDAAYKLGEFALAISTYEKGLEALDLDHRKGFDMYSSAGIFHNAPHAHFGLLHPRGRYGMQETRDSLQNNIGAAELRLEVEQVAREAALHAKEHSQSTKANGVSIEEDIHQSLKWHFAISLAGKDAAGVQEYGQQLRTVLKFEPDDGSLKAALEDMKQQWSQFLRGSRSPKTYRRTSFFSDDADYSSDEEASLLRASQLFRL